MTDGNNTEKQSLTEQEHAMEVESTQVWGGVVLPSEADLLTGDGHRTNIRGRKTANSFDLEFRKETKLTFECECGRRFRKPETAREHLEDVRGN